ncbi:hypothetical protein RB614_14180 [Phytohabitans sp. ZYX-F-186]|uniref:Uncharacterized protein n=1 Tax=Phytohabitans maris TaxID=3071409 RepID=A0ABU0ZI89_9ACTN|nr:hypothetical protein [Phytohabitans sp. ZYX-F-186]MDQ7905662.1 hypothetical protein [Phytohabitans sp. ZYX-F-186]
MYSRRWPSDRPHDSDPFERGEIAVLIVAAVRWLVTILLTSWGYLE